jgi:hypothetical protein
VIFLATLEQTGNVRVAAAARMNRASAYRLRERPDGRTFSHAWELALSRRRERLLRERLAKATVQLARLDRDGKGESRLRRISSRESGESDTTRRSEEVRQPRQLCRLSILPVTGRGTAAGGGGGPSRERHWISSSQRSSQ